MQCLILGDPEIMRIYPEGGMVFIDRRKLGDWGMIGKPVPISSIGALSVRAMFVLLNAWSNCLVRHVDGALFRRSSRQACVGHMFLVDLLAFQPC